jgi:MFS transporter, DHA2 family, multidrug resistance protein
MESRPVSAPPVPLHQQLSIHARRWFLLGIMCLSLVLVVMTVSGLNTALPTIQRDLGASASELQWIVDAYAMVFAGLLLSAGEIGDRFGRRRALLGGLAVFGLGTLIGGVASSSSQLIAGRAVMGIGAAFIMPATLSIITAIFPPDERTRAIAIWAGFAGAGASIGPVVTGGLLEGFWWGSTMLVNVPIVVAIIAAVVMFAPDSRDETRAPLDPGGALLSLVGLSSLIFAIIQGPDDGSAAVCSRRSSSPESPWLPSSPGNCEVTTRCFR